MGKIYTDYNEYLQDAYERQSDRYLSSNNVNNERAQEATRQQGNTGKVSNFSVRTFILGA